MLEFSDNTTQSNQQMKVEVQAEKETFGKVAEFSRSIFQISIFARNVMLFSYCYLVVKWQKLHWLVISASSIDLVANSGIIVTQIINVVHFNHVGFNQTMQKLEWWLPNRKFHQNKARAKT